MKYGITEQGFVRKSYSVILAETQAKAQALFGNDIDLSDASPDGLWVKLMSWAIDRQWQNAEDVYYSLWISTSTGVSLDRAVKFGFVSRRDKTCAIVILVFSGTNGISIPAGTFVATENNIIFSTLSDAVISNGTVQVSAQCKTAGPDGIVAANSVNTIKTPIAGLDSVTNPSSSYNGYSRETDKELRDKYASLPSATGSSTNAIRTALSQLPGVSFVRVFDNETESTNESGLPPHTIEVVINGGEESLIASTILSKKPAGAGTYGSIEKFVTDVNGLAKQIKFSRPELIPVYVVITITKDTTWVDSNTSLIKRAVIKYIGGVDDLETDYSGVGVGQSVYKWKLTAAQAGIGGISAIEIGIGKTVSAAETRIDDLLIFAARELPQTSIDKVIVRFS